MPPSPIFCRLDFLLIRLHWELATCSSENALSLAPDKLDVGFYLTTNDQNIHPTLVFRLLRKHPTRLHSDPDPE